MTSNKQLLTKFALSLFILPFVGCSALDNGSETEEIINYHINLNDAELTNADSVTIDVWQGDNLDATHQTVTDGISDGEVVPQFNVPDSMDVTMLARVYLGGNIVGGLLHSFVAGNRVKAKSLSEMDFTTERYAGIYDTISVLSDFTSLGFTTASCSVDGANDAGNCALYFADSGSYVYTVSFSDDIGHRFYEGMTVHVLQGSPTIAGCSDLEGYINNAVSFGICGATDAYTNGITGGIVMFKWDYNGDGVDDDSSSVDTVFNHPYPDSSADTTYTAKLTVRDNDGNEVTAARTVYVANRAPALALSASDVTPVITQTITFTATLTDADSNQIDSLWWDLDGDGAFNDAATLTGVTLRDSFPDTSGGTYRVEVRAKDVWGLYDTVGVTIRVSANRAPVLTVIADDPVPDVGQTVSLSAALSDLDSNQIDSVWWDLDGDGIYETVRSVAETLSFSVPSSNDTIRAYAEDAWGLKDSAIFVFGFVIDSRDENWYRIVKIGDQIWMAENLNYDTLNGTKSWCYNNTDSYCTTYGRLYTWDAVMAGSESSEKSPSGVKGICPEGWHVPSSAEWDTLANYAGGEDSAQIKLQAVSTLWLTNTGTDLYGFSALPGGSYDGSSFNYVGNSGYWWTATESFSTYAFAQLIQSYYTYANQSAKTSGFSLRCVQD
ncbi:MAG TPA: FISUMP domain-containing protein [Fibrobacteraceae bacterium]|nr:FISUMP domain-containing protein [Fibrobacteraceae bacterium]